MEITFLLLSAFFLQVPFAFYQHSVRKFNRLSQYNPMGQIDYTVNYGTIDNVGYKTVVFICGLLAVVPLLKVIDLHWIFVVLINFLALYVITPVITFLTYPPNKILSPKMHTALAVVSILVSIIFYLIGVFTT